MFLNGALDSGCHFKKRNLSFKFPPSCFDAAATVILSKRSTSKEAVAALLSMTSCLAPQEYLFELALGLWPSPYGSRNISPNTESQSAPG